LPAVATAVLGFVIPATGALLTGATLYPVLMGVTGAGFGVLIGATVFLNWLVRILVYFVAGVGAFFESVIRMLAPKGDATEDQVSDEGADSETMRDGGGPLPTGPNTVRPTTASVDARGEGAVGLDPDGVVSRPVGAGEDALAAA